MMVNCNEIQSFYPEFYASYLSNPDRTSLPLFQHTFKFKNHCIWQSLA